MALRNGADLRYVHEDHLTGTSVVSDALGNQVGSIKYLPYGSTRSSSGSLDTDKKFTGQRLDGTGLYYYNARYYDPTIGRFISADVFVQMTDVFGVFSSALTVNLSASLMALSNSANPVDSRGATTYPQGLNRYSYTFNNPLRYVDPSGWDVRIIQMNVITWGVLCFGGASYDIWFEDDYGGVARITGSGWGVRTPTLASVTSTEGWFPKTVEGAETVLDLQGWSSEWGYSAGRWGGFVAETYSDGQGLATGGWSIDIGLPVEAHKYWTFTSVEVISQPQIGGLFLNLVETPVMVSNSGVFWVRYSGNWLMYDPNDPIGSNLTMNQIAELQILQSGD